MSDNTRPAGSEQGSGPAPREQVVTKDKRTTDQAGSARADAATETPAEAGAPAEEPKPTMGQPATSSAPAAKADAPPVEQVAGDAPAEVGSLRSELDERLRDLQRITAEYANYRKRVERDRGLVAEQAIGNVASALLPILDDFDRAREHGDLVGPLGVAAEQLTTALAKFGLSGFGEQGDAFDPTRHEAVAHQTSAEVTEPTCVGIMRRGYLLGDRLLRPALVAVADPE